MATRDFEVQQLFKAYRKGVISEELLNQQMDELVNASGGHDAVPNVFALRGDGAKMAQGRLGKTPQTESMVFTLPPNFGGGHENSHRGDQLIYNRRNRHLPRVEHYARARPATRHDPSRGASHAAHRSREAVRVDSVCALGPLSLSDISDLDRSLIRYRRKKLVNLTSPLKLAIPVSRNNGLAPS